MRENLVHKNDPNAYIYYQLHKREERILLGVVCSQALLELWHVGVLKKFDEEKLLVRAEAARL